MRPNTRITIWGGGGGGGGGGSRGQCAICTLAARTTKRKDCSTGHHVMVQPSEVGNPQMAGQAESCLDLFASRSVRCYRRRVVWVSVVSAPVSGQRRSSSSKRSEYCKKAVFSSDQPSNDWNQAGVTTKGGCDCHCRVPPPYVHPCPWALPLAQHRLIVCSIVYGAVWQVCVTLHLPVLLCWGKKECGRWVGDGTLPAQTG